MRGARGDFTLGMLFPNLSTTGAASSAGDVGANDGHQQQHGHHHHHHHHLEEVLPDAAYLQHQIRASGGGGGTGNGNNGGADGGGGGGGGAEGNGGGGTGSGGGGSPTLRTGSSPGSSRSPHDDQQLSSPHRQGQSEGGGYSPSEHGRQSYAHLTAMQPPSSVQANHGLGQDTSDRVSDQLYMDSIYAHHTVGTAHHHQDHEAGSSTPHSPTGPLSRLVAVRSLFFHLLDQRRQRGTTVLRSIQTLRRSIVKWRNRAVPSGDALLRRKPGARTARGHRT